MPIGKLIASPATRRPTRPWPFYAQLTQATRPYSKFSILGLVRLRSCGQFACNTFIQNTVRPRGRPRRTNTKRSRFRGNFLSDFSRSDLRTVITSFSSLYTTESCQHQARQQQTSHDQMWIQQTYEKDYPHQNWQQHDWATMLCWKTLATRRSSFWQPSFLSRSAQASLRRRDITINTKTGTPSLRDGFNTMLWAQQNIMFLRRTTTKDHRKLFFCAYP